MVTVTAILSSIDVTLANSSIADDGTTQATVTATMSDNSTMDVTGSATYSSDDASVATVDSSGLVSGVSPGMANITADYNGESDTTSGERRRDAVHRST
ncbi:MAG: Ig-like domain-containing protein [Natrialbaceae archaeon]|nr:Ig-like domain-containing protein [Natrialbaceae archaeon]